MIPASAGMTKNKIYENTNLGSPRKIILGICGQR